MPLSPLLSGSWAARQIMVFLRFGWVYHLLDQLPHLSSRNAVPATAWIEAGPTGVKEPQDQRRLELRVTGGTFVPKVYFHACGLMRHAARAGETPR
ncbi:hypothetical protein CABS01_14459 [Colletotrichum abscissum]|uniref:uncharacterized protein n=1 Tax=Colletotrichum abscissum TaxID=1671311 RepID=UPI0027D55F00|nr:uncharacterized protein CABS01_14459 [Colletotrichum abscissum]KAK1480321.1 hypothetical protein CABS01_14459 [Colletotrichum abscissum]